MRAAVPENSTPTAETEDLVAFLLGATYLGVPAERVVEIDVLRPSVRLPRTPAWIEGIVPLRGGAVPLLDLSRFVPLGRVLEKRTSAPSELMDMPERVVVAQSQGMRVGIRCQLVRGIVSVPRIALGPPTTRGHELSEFVISEHAEAYGVVFRLDLDKLLTAAKLR